MRKLATIEKIGSIQPIPEADAIEAASIRGWTVVTKRGEFNVGDPCVYVEIDAQLPLADPRFEFLAARGEKTLGDGSKVHVLKTARLRGVYSQGLALPLSEFPELADAPEGEDVASRLNIEKWEPPLPAGSDEVIGEFPTDLVRKTDAERVQNLGQGYARLHSDYEWVATEKIDGTSATFFKQDGAFRVCGRNWEIDPVTTLHGRVAAKLGLSEKLQDGEVVQGEIYGEGVQGNPLKLRGTHFGVFSFFRNRVSVGMTEWPEWARELAVPRLSLTLPYTIAEAVAQVDGMMSALNESRLAEGVVWHTTTGELLQELEYRSGFKAISNKYLLKHS